MCAEVMIYTISKKAISAETYEIVPLNFEKTVMESINGRRNKCFLA